MKIARYIVQYFDDEIGAWFDGSPPLNYKAAALAQAFYAVTFDTRLVWHSSL